MKDFSVEIEVEEIPEDYPGIVPVFMNYENNEIYFEIYKGLENQINSFINDYHNRYFTKEAFDYLCNCVDGYLLNKPYKRDKYGQTRFYRKFMLEDKASVNQEVIKPSTVMMHSQLEDIPNLTTLFAEDTGKIPSLSFVSVEGGKIVSVATVNDTQSQHVKEITVNTALKYRGKGLGASNTAALSDYLLKNGYNVAYCVSNYNKASIKIAKKCGFKETGKFYAVSAYKTNIKEDK